MSFEGILNQIFQPYFYYSVVSLVISFIAIKAFSKFFVFMGQRTKSILYLVPLALPIIVMLLFVPSTIIQTTHRQLTATPVTTATSVGTFPSGLFFPPPPQTGYLITAAVTTTTALSVTGIICIIGLIAGTLFALSMILADDRLARKLLHVIPLSKDEHQWLQTKIDESSQTLGIASPRIGLVEDLRPNAFTIGYGHRATLVFSMGIFNILDKEEISAVAFHELAHVKNHDFFFKTLSSALTAISFFNPLSYITSSTAQREREMYADERALKLLDQPSALANALAKISKAMQTFPEENKIANLSSNLLVTSSVLHRLGILATHPRLDTRLRNLSEPKPSIIHLKPRKVWSVFFLSVLMISLAIVVSGAMVNLQVNYSYSQYLKAQTPVFKVADYNVPSGSSAIPSGWILLPFSTSQTTAMPIGPSYNSPANNINTAIGMGNYANMREIPAGTVVYLQPLNESYAATASSGRVPYIVWFG